MSAYVDRWRDYIMSTNKIRHGTEAHHMLGDISRPSGDYFIVDQDDGDDYVGHWLTGFGFIEVRFPKHTTRDISDDERTWLAEHPVVIT